MFERFTNRARKVMALANQQAQQFNHEYVGTEHILLGLVGEGGGMGAIVLKNLGVDLKKLMQFVKARVIPGPDMMTMGKLPQTLRAKKVIEYAIEEARKLNHNWVGTEHLLLGLIHPSDTPDDTIGIAFGVLSQDFKLSPDQIRREVLALLGAGVSEEPEEVAAAVFSLTAKPAERKQVCKVLNTETSEAKGVIEKRINEILEESRIIKWISHEYILILICEERE